MSRMCTRSSLCFEVTQSVFFHSWMSYRGVSLGVQVHDMLLPAYLRLSPTSRILPMTLPTTMGGRSGNRLTNSFRNSLVEICR